jgi:glycosyltransferase involved in cell wall biosynthesis
MRVLYVNPGAELGGSERSLLDLLASFQHSLLAVEKKLVLFADGELARLVRGLGIEVEILGLPSELETLGESSGGSNWAGRIPGALRAALASLPTLRAIRRSAKEFRAELVHTNGTKAHVLAALALPELPRVVHLRDFVSARPVTRRLVSLLGRRALIVTNSKAVEDDALGVARSLRTRVVYNGIDLDEFRPRPRDLEHLAALSGLDVPPPSTVVVGLVATYAHWKGHRTFLDAARELRLGAPEIPLRFYVIGGPVYRTRGSEIGEGELREAVERAGLVRDVGFVPFQNDVARAYRGLDVMVHASERPEPFGRTIVEAMASGRAVVVARGGGAVELFSEGRSGLGFEPGDVRSLVQALRTVVGDAELRRSLAAEGRADAEARFGRTRLAPEIFSAYRELLKDG